MFDYKTEKFIQKIKNKGYYNPKNDYSKVVYISYYEKIIIGCYIHGDFQTTPSNIFKGCGCQICGGSIKLTNETFIKKANIVHNNKYKYPNINYINNKSLIDIVCEKHGKFQQQAVKHLSGKGCKKCNSRISNKEELLLKLKNKGYFEKDGVYENCDFSKFIYINSGTKSIVIKNGFEHNIHPDNLLLGSSLIMCNVINKEEFIIKKAKDIHTKINYDYSKFKYNGKKSKMLITCPYHGDFLQTVSSHLSGKGCPVCAKTGFNVQNEAWFYIYKLEQDGKVGIGYGITNIFLKRHRYHKNTFKKTNTEGTLIYKEYFKNGVDALELERIIKKYSSNINFGIDGFKTECLSIGNYQLIMNEISKINGRLALEHFLTQECF